MGSFEFHGRKNIKTNMNFFWENCVNNPNSQMRKGAHQFLPLGFQGVEFLQQLAWELYDASYSLEWGSSSHCEPYQHFHTSDALPPSKGPGYHAAGLCMVAAPDTLSQSLCTSSLHRTQQTPKHSSRHTWRPLLWVLPNSPNTICWPSLSPSIVLDQISVVVFFMCVYPQNNVDPWILGHCQSSLNPSPAYLSPPARAS